VALKDGKVFSSENNHIVCFVSLIVNAKRNVSIDGSRTIDCLYDNFDQISRNNFGLVKKKKKKTRHGNDDITQRNEREIYSKKLTETFCCVYCLLLGIHSLRFSSSLSYMRPTSISLGCEIISLETGKKHSLL
jgi:hypothetical protein